MDHPPRPDSPAESAVPAAQSSAELIEQTPEFRELRSTFRGFAFPVTVGFLLWYLLYVLLSSYAHGFMATKLFGNVNVALLLGLLQFASTFAIAAWYARFADRRLDPPATALRAEYGQVNSPREAAE
ncbi:DUF485 domain-containing protein [Streptomyces tateyamensis]|uniref:DUF485 domain-containing protein n=1 Tax=Streptomyces tateyamensis TaxID=565073 RepID=UPI001FE7AAD1|nr:DUF485 domain-containing protein [Streptomyces tateyamensis]